MVWVREIANRCWNPTYKNIGDTSDCGWFVIGASSIVAVAGNFGQTNYAASKAGLEAMLFALAEEFARMGVRVNLVAPGLVDTGMAAAIPEAATKAFTDRTLAGRLINPVEVARVVTFLASDAASGINQAVIPINGGQRLLVMPE
jgi:3-oxoacyl-[acyl-carrier protein] reductase